MNIVARRSGGQNVIGRPQARPNWYRPAGAPAARAQVWKRNADQAPSAAVLVGVFELGKEYSFDFNPVADRNVLLGVNPLAADGTPSFSRPEDFVWAELVVSRDHAAAAGLDDDVPTVTLAPTVAKSDVSDVLIVLTPAPDAYGATLTDCEIRVEKADDATVFTVWPEAPGPTHRIDQTAYPAKVSYRYRNQADEDGPDGGRGWSAWSPKTDAAEIGAAVPPPPASGAGGALETFEPDPEDSRAGIRREIVVA